MYESEFEERFYNERREKLKLIAELGRKMGAASDLEATYPNSYAVSAAGWSEAEGALVPWLKRKYEAATTEELEASRVEVSVAGRVMAIRAQGKAGFAQLQQAGERLQIYVRKDDVGEDAFALYKLLDLGDHIGVRGYLMRTRTGELTVHVKATDQAQALTFLAKAMLPLPDKFHGLEDVELRYRRRYLDLFTDTGELESAAAEAAGAVTEPAGEAVRTRLPAREVFVKRAAVLRAMRKFFDARGYLEVETPMMHTVAGGAAAKPFNTHHNALDIPLKLRIAPELYLKRLVVGGMDRVYEINRNFRNEGISTQHNPEFTMLEFYQAYSNYHELMELTEELVKYVAMEVNGTLVTSFNGVEIDLGKWQKLSMRGAIIRWWPQEFGPPPTMDEFDDPKRLSETFMRAKDLVDDLGYGVGTLIRDDQPYVPMRTRENDLSNAANNLSVLAGMIESGWTLGKVISASFEVIGETLGHLIQPTIIYDFPLAVSPLSKVKPDEPDWVERFEFYIGGFEVGNAFSELNDPDDQLARFEAQLEERKRGDEEAMAEVDEDYVRALGYGLPPTAGEGIGIDRLTMILTGSKSIRDVILFPLLRPLAKAAE